MRKILLAALISVLTFFNSWSQQLAFPTAEGFGAYSKGGRGGQVLYVTNLNDNGPGSLRWAVEQEGPRTVLFTISGTIVLEGNLSIDNPYITIAGQTAPGDGITLRDAALLIKTHDVVVRYIRVRLGDQGKGGDAISISKGHDIIIDHCSAGWSTDEVLSASTGDPDLTDVTVQWCFITEGLNPENHSFGSLIRGTAGAKYSYHHNLYAHNRGRNPRPGNYNSYEIDPEGFLLDFRNNVIYNWRGGYAGYNSDSESITKLNYVGNFLIPGPESNNTGYAYRTGSPYNKAWFHENYYDYKKPGDRWDIVRYNDDWSEQVIEAYKQNQAFPAGPVETDEPKGAFDKVLAYSGASIPLRDSVDVRVVNDILNRTGSIIDSQSEVGGWPELRTAEAPEESDSDGMPDWWEVEHELDPNDPVDGNFDRNSDGYTNLEEYLNWLADPDGRFLDRHPTNGEIGFVPGPIPLTYPEANMMGVDLQPDFSWKPVEYAVKYQFSLLSSVFETIIDTIATKTTFEYPVELNAGSLYHWRVRGINETGGEGIWSEQYWFMTQSETSINTATEIPSSYRIEQNYPNPFNSVTIIRYGLPESGYIQLGILDQTGRRIANIESGNKPAGYHEVIYDAASLASGVYVLKLGAFPEGVSIDERVVQTRKMTLIK